MLTLYHSRNTRSLRVLWTLEELGIKADVKSMPFPPRKLQPDYLSINPTGALPVLIDGDLVLSESLAICEYLASKHGSSLVVAMDEPERAPFLQWLWYGESTLMTPLSRMAVIGRVQRKSEDIDALLADARDSALVRLAALEHYLDGRAFLVAGRLTLADISVGYALHLVGLFGGDSLIGPRISAYRAGLLARPAFQRAAAVP